MTNGEVFQLYKEKKQHNPAPTQRGVAPTTFIALTTFTGPDLTPTDLLNLNASRLVVLNIAPSSRNFRQIIQGGAATANAPAPTGVASPTMSQKRHNYEV
jgi:hypothetical protein